MINPAGPLVGLISQMLIGAGYFIKQAGQFQILLFCISKEASTKLKPVSIKLEFASRKLKPVSIKLEFVSTRLKPISRNLELASTKLEPISIKLELASTKL